MFGVEVDAMPGGYVCSASLKSTVKADAVLKSVSGAKRLSKLFSAGQQSFFGTHAPSGLTLDDLSVLGPIFVLKLKLPPATYPRRIVVEMWLYPDGARILELSTKATPQEALMVAVEVRRFLEDKGMDLSGQQQTKTRTALEFYAAELRRLRPRRTTMRLVIRWVLLAAVIAVVAWIVPDVDISGGVFGLLVAAAVFGLVNVLVGPLLRLLTLPLTMMTFGLFSLVVNGILLALTAGLTSFLDVGGLIQTIVAAFLISVLNTLSLMVTGGLVSRTSTTAA